MTNLKEIIKRDYFQFVLLCDYFYLKELYKMTAAPNIVNI